MSEKAVFRTLLGMLALLVAAIYAIAPRSDKAAPSAPMPGGGLARFQWHDVPRAVPATAFRDARGSTVTLGDFKGKVVLVNLWATWCAPCVREMPALDRLAARAPSGLAVIAISQDRDADEARAWLKAQGLHTLAFFHDPKGALLESLQGPGLPLSVLIDPQGEEVGRMAGPAEWDSETARGLIERAAGAPPAG